MVNNSNQPYKNGQSSGINKTNFMVNLNLQDFMNINQNNSRPVRLKKYIIIFLECK